MKINKLRFKNLNSLLGEWMIDFTSPEYVSDGIFAISGPTGAGKSTILDGICLALYGCTPRLSKISDSTNEIMSRHTGECFAEVEFETGEGSFRAHWSQRRSRGKADGQLQQPRHEISDIATGAVLASQLRTTASMIVEKTGMDFDRFTQSMMLAQGGFAAFLKATANERAPILEQITGTEVYSQISIHIFQQQRSEREKLDKLKAESDGIMLMSSEEETEIRMQIEEMNRTKSQLSEKKLTLDSAIKWLKKIAEINQQLSEITQKELSIDNDIIEFEPHRQKLKMAISASNIEGNYASLLAVRKQQREETESLARMKQELPSVLAAIDSLEKAFNVSGENCQKLKEERDTLNRLSREVRLSDQEITRLEASVLGSLGIIEKLNSEKNSQSAIKAGIEKEINSLNTEYNEITGYRQINSTDEFLVAGFTGVEMSFERFSDAQHALKAAELKLESEKKELLSKSEQLVKNTELLRLNTEKQQRISAEIQRVDSEMVRLLNGETLESLTRKKDDLILAIAGMKQVEGYESARSELADGKPCPLCGSIHHPYASGNIPASADAEKELKILFRLLEEYNALSQSLNELSNQKIKFDKECLAEKSRFDILDSQKGGLEKSVDSCMDQLNKAKSAFENISRNLKVTLVPLGISEIPAEEKDIFGLQSDLRGRRDKWVNYEARKAEIERLLQEHGKTLAVTSTIIDAKDKEVKVKSDEIVELQSSLDNTRKKRIELFGTRNPDEEEEIAEKKVTDSETLLNNAGDSLGKKRESLAGIKAKISDTEINISNRVQSLSGLNDEFSKLLSSAGFENEESFLQHRMTVEERARLEKKMNEIDKQKTELSATRRAKSNELLEEESKKLTDKNAGELAPEYAKVSEQFDRINTEIGLRAGRLEANEKAKGRGLELAERISSQTSVWERWSKLNGLIGSADGRKYRNFVQGLTLEIMVNYANVQLSKLNDRYLLVRNSEEPLELDVIDNYQAGEIRSTKNLSGGETFIVSLALALGLSGMASRKVRVDSLFLDEGFGTLDEETLETALSTLAGLRQEGKMIGVISHVGAMKERINTKIIVEPVCEGRSIIRGPGCCRR